MCLCFLFRKNYNYYQIVILKVAGVKANTERQLAPQKVGIQSALSQEEHVVIAVENTNG